MFGLLFAVMDLNGRHLEYMVQEKNERRNIMIFLHNKPFITEVLFKSDLKNVDMIGNESWGPFLATL